MIYKLEVTSSRPKTIMVPTKNTKGKEQKGANLSDRENDSLRLKTSCVIRFQVRIRG